MHDGRGFRVLVTKYMAESTMLGPGNPYIGEGPKCSRGVQRPWMALCQDRFPPMHPDDDGLLPPIFGETRDEAMDGMHTTIKERLVSQGLTQWDFLSFEGF